MRGLLITFEGTEATGKGARVQRLVPWLQERGCTVCSLREPGGTPTGEELRRVLKHQPDCAGMDPVTELLLMNASRAELVRKIIRPSLAHVRPLLRFDLRLSGLRARFRSFIGAAGC